MCVGTEKTINDNLFFFFLKLLLQGLRHVLMIIIDDRRFLSNDY